MLVVGSRGLGGFAGLLLGSVSLQCAHHAGCPVVIVPEPVRTEETSNRTIVVGIDGSPGAQRGLEWAAREARLRNARLKIMLAWQLPFALYAGPGKFGVERELLEELRKIAADRLDEACSAAAPALEGLAVERSVVEAEAAPALIEAAKDADLLVVGTRGHGGFAGLLLGSVSQHCAHHARCPVVIVPPPRS